MTPLRMAVIGVGHLGKAHARVLAEHPQVELVAVADTHPGRAAEIARLQSTRPVTDFRELFDQVDAVSVVVPTRVHRQVAVPFLERGIPVMVEKPLAGNTDDAREMVARARATDTVLQVGHIERFNPAFKGAGQFRVQPKFIECHRLGRHTFRSVDVGVVFDLMIHDLDIILYLVNSEVTGIEALGVSVLGRHEDIANCRLTFANGCVANITASRISGEALRRMRMFSTDSYLSLDFGQRTGVIIRKTDELDHARRTIQLDALTPEELALLKDKFFGEWLALDTLEFGDEEPLALELGSFVQCVRTGQKPVVDGAAALRSVELAERIVAAIAEHSWDGPTGNDVGLREWPQRD